MEFFAKNLKYLRKIKGISQQKFADDIGMSRDGINSIENKGANPSISTLIKIRNYFNVNLDDLIFVDLENKS